jgi:hypothetical protein
MPGCDLETTVRRANVIRELISSKPIQTPFHGNECHGQHGGRRGRAHYECRIAIASRGPGSVSSQAEWKEPCRGDGCYCWRNRKEGLQSVHPDSRICGSCRSSYGYCCE